MLIIGAKGFAKEVLEVLHQLNQLDDLVFYDDLNHNIPKNLYGKFPVLRSFIDASNYFKIVNSSFTIGIGNPVLRKKMYDQFIAIGGRFESTISPFAKIGSFDSHVEVGCNIMNGAIISNGVTIGKGCIVYFNSIISHDCKIGDFVEISPSVNILGSAQIDSYSQIGSNATVLPNIKIGKNVIVGAGSVVTKDVPDNCLVVGVPATIKKMLSKIENDVK